MLRGRIKVYGEPCVMGVELSLAVGAEVGWVEDEGRQSGARGPSEKRQCYGREATYTLSRGAGTSAWGGARAGAEAWSRDRREEVVGIEVVIGVNMCVQG